MPYKKHIFRIAPLLIFRPFVYCLRLHFFIGIAHFREISVAFPAAIEVELNARNAGFCASSGKKFVKAHQADTIDTKAMKKTHCWEFFTLVRESDISTDKFISDI